MRGIFSIWAKVLNSKRTRKCTVLHDFRILFIFDIFFHLIMPQTCGAGPFFFERNCCFWEVLRICIPAQTASQGCHRGSVIGEGFGVWLSVMQGLGPGGARRGVLPGPAGPGPRGGDGRPAPRPGRQQPQPAQRTGPPLSSRASGPLPRRLASRVLCCLPKEGEPMIVQNVFCITLEKKIAQYLEFGNLRNPELCPEEARGSADAIKIPERRKFWELNVVAMASNRNQSSPTTANQGNSIFCRKNKHKNYSNSCQIRKSVFEPLALPG